MNKKIFDKRLFADMFNQQKLIALALIAFCLVITVISVISCYTSLKWDGSYSVLTIENALPMLYIFMFVGGIALPFRAFSFLNKRNSSDFYHSLPISSTSMFVSISASCIAWSLIAIVSNIAALSLGHLVLGIPFDYSILPGLLISYGTGTLLVLATAILAVSITGTRFTNFVLCMLIMFLPRFVFLLMYGTVMDSCQILHASSLPFLGNGYNFVTSSIFTSLLSMLFGEGNSVFCWQTYLYTGALAVVYFVVAWFAFLRRKSETANRVTSSPLLSHVYRVAVALPLLLVAAKMIVSSTGAYTGISADSLTIVTLVVLSFLAYILFELITTKSAKRMVKSIPVYLVAIAIAVAFGFCTLGVCNAVLSDIPKADKIKCIRVSGTDEGFSYSCNSYSEIQLAKTSYDDSELIELAAKRLESTVEKVRNQSLYNGNADEYTKAITFILKDGRQVKRTICFRSADNALLDEKVYSTDKYLKAAVAFPDEKEIYNISVERCSEEYGKKIWESFKAEYNELSDANKLLLVSNPDACVDEGPIATISISGITEKKSFSSTYFITSLTPKTYNMLKKQLKAEYIESFNSFRDFPKLLENPDLAFYSLNFTIIANDYDNGKTVNDLDISLNLDSSYSEKLMVSDAQKAINVANLLCKASVEPTGAKNEVDITLTNFCCNAFTDDGKDCILSIDELELSIDKADLDALIKLVKASENGYVREIASGKE